MSAWSLETLMACCSTQASRPELQAPFALDIGGERWSVGTDGMRLLAVRADFGLPIPDAPNPAVIREGHTASRSGTSISVSVLREFLSAHVPAPQGTCTACNDKVTEDCEVCDGDGYVDCECLSCGHTHDVKCTVCNGKGSWTCAKCAGRYDRRLVRIGECRYDAGLTAPLFLRLPDCEARLDQRPYPHMTTLGGDDWFVALMPLRDDDGDLIPTLEIPKEVAA